ncbi:hypothetical protein CEXT_176581 [Caerostris extrusa]|uniref:Uncharacterized protein n=1 Tax=Caerostris extrusa TaxID=172846 RepID=A0AAV4NG15_CAEEX|nr:hypothetical protein CEXT_176581 [Caerostris extrusa]
MELKLSLESRNFPNIRDNFSCGKIVCPDTHQKEKDEEEENPHLYLMTSDNVQNPRKQLLRVPFFMRIYNCLCRI